MTHAASKTTCINRTPLRPLHALAAAAALLLSLGVAGCGGGGALRPSAYTIPPSYLDSFPLGVSRDELLAQLGPPTTELKVEGSTFWTYNVGGAAEKRYTYELVEGKVVDVRYFDNGVGTYSGSSARTRQARAAAESATAGSTR